MSLLRIGLHGVGGHQIQSHVASDPRCVLAGISNFPSERLPEAQRPCAKVYANLDAMLKDPGIDLISLCSPRRRNQADEAIACMQAGKHVYAEKPCAMTEADLDALIQTAAQTGKVFHEMAGTAFEAPYASLRKLVLDGTLGEIVQIHAQKSYPYHDSRPQDEDVDGGLLMQVGVHALRMIEHIGGQRIEQINAMETGRGNPVPGNLRMACAMTMRLANKGIATATANYLNQRAFPSWGYEVVRIFGTKGFAEITDAGRASRLVTEDYCGPLKLEAPGADYFTLFMNELLDGSPMPLSLQDELHPTRMVIRAKVSARQ